MLPGLYHNPGNFFFLEYTGPMSRIKIIFYALFQFMSLGFIIQFQLFALGLHPV